MSQAISNQFDRFRLERYERKSKRTNIPFSGWIAACRARMALNQNWFTWERSTAGLFLSATIAMAFCVVANLLGLLTLGQAGAFLAGSWSAHTIAVLHHSRN